MNRLRWYGANPLHLLTLVASFALAGYAATRLLVDDPWGVALWFIGAAVVHDLVLFPLYAIADRSVQGIVRRRPLPTPFRPWVNYLRAPALLSGLLFLVWSPLILRLPDDYESITALPISPYLGHWLLVTGTLFAISAIALAVQLRRHTGSGPYSPVSPSIRSRSRSR